MIYLLTMMRILTDGMDPENEDVPDCMRPMWRTYGTQNLFLPTLGP